MEGPRHSCLGGVGGEDTDSSSCFVAGGGVLAGPHRLMYELHVIVVHEIEHVEHATLKKGVTSPSFLAQGCGKKEDAQVKGKVWAEDWGDSKLRLT